MDVIIPQPRRETICLNANSPWPYQRQCFQVPKPRIRARSAQAATARRCGEKSRSTGCTMSAETFCCYTYATPLRSFTGLVGDGRDRKKGHESKSRNVLIRLTSHVIYCSARARRFATQGHILLECEGELCKRSATDTIVHLQFGY